LARASSHVATVRLGCCDIGPEGGDKCMTEVVRLVRRVGIGSQARFLEEVDLHGNHLDADAVRKIVEAAVKERCERPQDAPSAAIWLDLSGNKVRNPASVFQNLQAWAGWAYNCENALCLADQEGCSRTACPKKSMLHLPGFLEQTKPEPSQVVKQDVKEVKEVTTVAASRPEPRENLPLSLPPSAARWQPQPQVQPQPQHYAHDPSRPRDRRRRRGGRRRRRKNKSSASPPRLNLRPGPGVAGSSGESASSRSRSRSRYRSSSRSPRDTSCGSSSGEEARVSHIDGGPPKNDRHARSSVSDDSPSCKRKAAAQEHLDERISRLIESLKSSAATSVLEEPKKHHHRHKHRHKSRHRRRRRH